MADCPPINPDASDDTPFEALAGKSLKAAGYAYLVGDAALFASGLMAGRMKEAASGLLYTVGGLTCAKYGNPDSEKQLQLLSGRLRDYLHKQHIEIPKMPGTELLTRQDGIIDHIESFLYKYPSQILNATYVVGGVQLMRSGLQAKKPWDAASGALVTAGGLAGLLVSEKKPDPDHPPTSALGKAWSWLQEKPLRISGGMYALNNVTLILSALNERKTNPAQKSYLFKFLTAASYIFGNVMLSMSSKDGQCNDAEDKKNMEKLADEAALVIAAQAPPLQKALIDHIAGFLAAQPDVHLKAEEIGEILYRKMHSLGAPQQNWQQRLSGQLPASPSLS